MITKRDAQVLEFIDKFKVATTDTIAELFYPSLQVAQRRLRELSKKELKRERYYFNTQYIYYKKKTTQLRHNITLTNFYRELSKIAKIEEFTKHDNTIKGIEPDAFIAYRCNGNNYIAFIEVEISKKGLDLDKYKRLYLSGEYEKYFPAFPKIIVISNTRIKKDYNFDIVRIDTELKNIGLLK